MQNNKSSLLPGLTQNIGPSERALSLFTGSMLLYRAFSKGTSVTSALAAGYLLFRGATGHCAAYHALGNMGVDVKPHNINIKTSFTVNKPASEIYSFWRKLENLSLFMKHLENVEEIDDTTSEWTAKIPGLGNVSWISEIILDERDKSISWHSQPGTMIENAGHVEFIDAGEFGTEVHVAISYHAPVGKIGETIGKLFSPMFKEMLKEDVKNLKLYMETGEMPTTENQPSGSNPE